MCLSHLLGCCLYSSKGSLSLNHLSVTPSMHLMYSVRLRIMMVSVRKERHCHRHHQISKMAVSSIFGNQNCILPFVVSTLFLSVTKSQRQLSHGERDSCNKHSPISHALTLSFFKNVCESFLKTEMI